MILGLPMFMYLLLLCSSDSMAFGLGPPRDEQGLESDAASAVAGGGGYSSSSGGRREAEDRTVLCYPKSSVILGASQPLSIFTCCAGLCCSQSGAVLASRPIGEIAFFHETRIIRCLLLEMLVGIDK